ncbi:MAG TPA: hypothetical protein DDW76_28360 [Cyanobacteria bacterium UBA11369]|nr:hypothetical protein [Cyanobacteria bacterium UBA11371]HBE34430.1 hypothetical protein [Cyanobacteria bacterium UBA11368]HBE52575.1 hypothetical protein [Cyanobacteria bacterium UBA11369]
MDRYERLYPNLKYFFSAFFHHDWLYMYNWQGQSPSFQVVVRDFKAKDSQAVTQTTRELEQFLAQHLTEDDEDLREIVVHKLGANFYAPGIGLTYQQWLQEILTILKE